jgi:Flp pilus assembly protein TadD
MTVGFYRARARAVNSAAAALLLWGSVAGAVSGDVDRDLERARQDESRLALIVDLVASGEFEAAVRELDAAGPVAQADPRWLNLRGLALAGLGRPADAVRAFEAGLRRDPTSAALHRNLAISLVELGARGRALSEFTQAVEIDASDAEAWVGLATLQTRLRRFEDARASVARLQDLRPADPRAWTALAELADAVGDSQSSRRAWAWLDEHSPDARTARRLAELESSDDPEAAIAHSVDCFERDASAIDCREMASRLALDSSRPARAIGFSEPALESLTESGYANLLWAAERSGHGDTIEEWVERRSPGSAPAWGIVALARRAAGDADGAALAVEAGLEFAETADLYNLLGVLRWEAGDRAAARDAWERALEVDPDHGPARENLRERSGPR